MIDDDTNGTYIKNIVLRNIEKCYLKVNLIDNYMNDMDQFLKNQDHINKLSEEKYKDKFLAKIISIISI
jgi:S-adenosylmethionine synthetase